MSAPTSILVIHCEISLAEEPGLGAISPASQLGFISGCRIRLKMPFGPAWSSFVFFFFFFFVNLDDVRPLQQWSFILSRDNVKHCRCTAIGRGNDLKGALEVLFQFQTRFPADDVQQSVRPTSQTGAKLSYIALSWPPAPFCVLPERSLQLSAAL